jgi:hexosaminidase
MARLTGMAIPIPGQPGSPQASLIVRTIAASKPVQSLDEDESYQLTITPAQAILTAPNPLGVLHGLETFFQLVTSTESGWAVPAARIEDRPRFPWRGLLLDVSRHFMPLDVIRRNLDGMAAVKLNVFHWHLSDDQGFRVESKTAPKLHELGSDGLFYAQDEIRSIIEYARDRGIRVVPEFDIPGHTQSWLAAYPEFAAQTGPVSLLRTWGISEASMDPTRPELYDFLERVLTEMASLFPDEYFHIGGDEVDAKHWNSSPRIVDYMKTNHLKDAAALQARFNQRIEAMLAKLGKHAEGWDEVLHAELPRSVVVQSWRGNKSLTDAARQGFSGLLSWGYYLDHQEPAAKLYLVDPLDGEAATLTPEQKARILGGEVCMWAEYVTPENVDSRIWPRSAAVAERLWSLSDIREVAVMYRRLEVVSAELTQLGLNHANGHRRMLERLAGSSDIDALKVLADVTEPGALGLRHKVNPHYMQGTPLNRFVDAVLPDSATARRFGEMVDRYLNHHSDSEARDELRSALNLWITNDTKVSASIGRRQIAQDVIPVSATLARIAGEGLAALAALEAERKLTPESIITALEGEKPVGEVLLAVAPHITRLVAAASPRTAAVLKILNPPKPLAAKAAAKK